MCYFAYSDYLKQKYFEKVYKAPVHLPFSCPNRDGICGTGGCVFCPEIGTGFENLPSEKSVSEQLKINMDFIGKSYNAKKFIAYFQNYTNTYCKESDLLPLLQSCLDEKIVEICFSTRPDAVTGGQLSLIEAFSAAHHLPVSFELGLQTANYKTLRKINRGHTLAEFIDAALAVKRHGFSLGAHLILNLPWDDDTDVIENAKILSVLHCDTAKLHSLYVVKGTPLAKMYQNGEISLCSKEEYFHKAGLFLCYLDPEIAIQRLFARSPAENSLFVTWNTSWRRLKDELLLYLKENDFYQGKYFDYADGAATRKKFG